MQIRRNNQNRDWIMMNSWEALSQNINIFMYQTFYTDSIKILNFDDESTITFRTASMCQFLAFYLQKCFNYNKEYIFFLNNEKTIFQAVKATFRNEWTAEIHFAGHLQYPKDTFNTQHLWDENFQTVRIPNTLLASALISL